MKLLLIMILMFGVAESRTALVGGTNYSSIESSELPDELELEHLMGFRLGIENDTKTSISGITYSQRGFSVSLDDNNYYYNYGNYSSSMESASFITNYITAYALMRIPLQPQLSLLAGGEVGFFMSGEITEEWSNGETDTESISRDEWIEDMDGNVLDYGLVIGAQFNITPQISAVGTYYLGLVEWADEADFKHRGFQIYLSYGL